MHWCGKFMSNGREPESCLGWVFNFKLGCFNLQQRKCTACTRPYLKLKNQARFCPVSWSCPWLVSFTFSAKSYNCKCCYKVGSGVLHPSSCQIVIYVKKVLQDQAEKRESEIWSLNSNAIAKKSFSHSLFRQVAMGLCDKQAKIKSPFNVFVRWKRFLA